MNEIVKKTGGRRKCRPGEKRMPASINLKPRHWAALDVLAESTDGSRSRRIEKWIVDATEVPTVGTDADGNFQSLEKLEKNGRDEK